MHLRICKDIVRFCHIVNRFIRVKGYLIVF